jgi:hypothetical protein
MLLSSVATPSAALFFRNYNVKEKLLEIKNDPSKAQLATGEVLKCWDGICSTLNQQQLLLGTPQASPQDFSFCRQYDIKSKLQQIQNNPSAADGVMAEVLLCWQGVVSWLRIQTSPPPMTALSMLRTGGAAAGAGFSSFPQRSLTLPFFANSTALSQSGFQLEKGAASASVKTEEMDTQKQRGKKRTRKDRDQADSEEKGGVDDDQHNTKPKLESGTFLFAHPGIFNTWFFVCSQARQSSGRRKNCHEAPRQTLDSSSSLQEQNQKTQ